MSTLNFVIMQANRQAPLFCTKSILIEASPERVWAVLTDINGWAEWQPDISRPKLLGPLQAGTRFDWKTGGAAIRSTLHTVEPYRHFGWTGKTFGLYAIHNWMLTEQNGRTLVTVEESMEGWPARLFQKAFQQNLEKGMGSWLERLKERAKANP